MNIYNYLKKLCEGHSQAFMGIYKHFKRQSERHSHDVLLRTWRFSRKNGKEKEEDITPRPLSQPTPIQETRASSTITRELRTMYVET
jgi:hypothetical protein